MPYFAILSVGQSQGRISFEHEMFFGYFLSGVFEQAVGAGGPVLGSLLTRGSLPGEVAERVAQSVRAEVLQENLSRISKSVDVARSARARENGGELARSMLVWLSGDGQELSRIVVQGLTFAGGSFGGLLLSRAQFKDVTFQRCDFSNAQLRDCLAEETMLLEVVVNPTKTRLELRGVNLDTQVAGLQVWIDDRARPSSTLGECETSWCSAEPSRQRLQSRRFVPLARRPSRLWTFLLARTGGPTRCASKTRSSSTWGNGRSGREIRKAMLATGVVTIDLPRATSGANKEFLRRKVLPEQLVAGINRRANIPPSVRAFWDELERVLPAHRLLCCRPGRHYSKTAGCTMKFSLPGA